MFCLGSAPPRFVGAESLALIISLPVQSSEPKLNSLAAQKQKPRRWESVTSLAEIYASCIGSFLLSIIEYG